MSNVFELLLISYLIFEKIKLLNLCKRDVRREPPMFANCFIVWSSPVAGLALQKRWNLKCWGQTKVALSNAHSFCNRTLAQHIAPIEIESMVLNTLFSYQLLVYLALIDTSMQSFLLFRRYLKNSKKAYQESAKKALKRVWIQTEAQTVLSIGSSSFS